MTNHLEGLIHHFKHPHQKKWAKFVDKAIYFVCIVGPIMTLPQIYKIWIEQNASGVSALSWSAYLITAIFWVLYGIAHKQKPLVIISSIWVVLEATIVTGTLIY